MHSVSKSVHESHIFHVQIRYVVDALSHQSSKWIGYILEIQKVMTYPVYDREC